MPRIHPTAIVEPGAELHASVVVGPYSIVESGASIGADCVIESQARIYAPVRMGRGNRVCHGAVLGCEPQDLAFTPDKSRPLVIGEGNHFKEYANIHRGVKTESGSSIGNGNYFMGGFHAGHDCVIGDHNVLGHNSVLAGHVTIGNRAFLSGLAAIHQFCRIGDLAMIAGCSKVVKDVPPYSTVDGNPARLAGLNLVGLRRGGFGAAQRAVIKQAYDILFHAGLNIAQALARLREIEQTPEVAAILDFFDQSTRGVTAHRCPPR
jgi:UDP-N-acetylglucosamine acyltransferase